MILIQPSAVEVQQKIKLAKIDGCPFDIRIVVQRRKNAPWTVTGLLANRANEGYIIANSRNSIGCRKETLLPSCLFCQNLDNGKKLSYVQKTSELNRGLFLVSYIRSFRIAIEPNGFPIAKCTRRPFEVITLCPTMSFLLELRLSTPYDREP